MESRDGGHGSSSSGTVVSTAYTCTGRSHLSSTSISMEAEQAMHLDWELQKMEKDKKVKQIKSLVQEFLGEPSVNYSIAQGCNMSRLETIQKNWSVLKRWFRELGIDWVLHLAHGVSLSPEAIEHAQIRSWILALAKITDTIRVITTSLFPSTSDEKAVRDHFWFFARFTQIAMSIMFRFVKAIDTEVVIRKGLQASYLKLNTLLSVHGALSKALLEIQLLFHPPPYEEDHGMVSLLSMYKEIVGKAIWSTMKDYRSHILDQQQDIDDNDSSGNQTQRGSPDIHKANRSIISYIKLLRANYLSADAVVLEAAILGQYVPITHMSPLDSMITGMTYCLEDKLVNVAQSFPDQGLRFLFLLNNSYFMLEELHQDFWSHKLYIMDLNIRVKDYMESYLQVSWAPLVSCLLDTTPLCLFEKSYSLLLKFESKFQKTYTTQKHWKVPDPELRNRLRTSITEKIIPSYTKYIADNNFVNTRIAPQELGEMLQKLFEG